MNFDRDDKKIEWFFLGVGYSNKFINGGIVNLENKITWDEPTNLPFLIAERKRLHISLSYCFANEILSKKLIVKLISFTNFNYYFYITR